MKPFEEIKKGMRCIWDNISNDIYASLKAYEIAGGKYDG